MTSATMRRDRGARQGEGYWMIVFAVALLVTVGFFNLIDGIAAIANSHVFIANAHYVVGDLRAWGWVVLILGSVLAAFAGILYSGHYGSISATQGSGWIFQVFAATVIGGVSLNGGKGSVFGALTGVLTLQLVVNVMTLAGVPPLWNQFLNGAIIIVALVISRFASGEKQE